MRRVLIAVYLLLSAVVFCGCSVKEPSENSKGEPIMLPYSIEEATKDRYYYMDRKYALTSDETKVMESELETAQNWLEKHIISGSDPAFDFIVCEKKFSDSYGEYRKETEKLSDTDVSVKYRTVFTQPDSVLSVTVISELYREYPIVEYTVYLTNVGKENSDVISEFLALDTEMETGGDIRLVSWKGSESKASDFTPSSELLPIGETKKLFSSLGKSSVQFMPYFSLSWDDESAGWGRRGIFCSVGWTGEWNADIAVSDGALTVMAQQTEFSSYLKPGETVRSPLVTVMFWEKDFVRSQNIWRKWMYNVAMPQPGGEPIKPSISGNTALSTAMSQTATTENQLEAIENWIRSGIDIDCWQIDAGYNIPDSKGSGWQYNSGNWTPDRSRFRNGSLSSVSDLLHKNGLKLILWHDTERVVGGTEFSQLFSDGLLDNCVKPGIGYSVLNLSDDGITDRLISYMTERIETEGIDIYRQDATYLDGAESSLLNYWHSGDEENRSGITENRYITNYYRFWDALLEVLPAGYIDNCASGGRRLDLESAKRSVPLWRSDHCYDPDADQCMTYGLNYLMPYTGTGTRDDARGTMKYSARSAYCASLLLVYRVDGSLTGDRADRYVSVADEFRSISGYLTKDYYPLTPYDNSDSCWMAWQYCDPSDTSGIIQAFRRKNSDRTSQIFFLSGLSPERTYTVTDMDTGEYISLTGRELMTSGLTIEIPESRMSVILKYTCEA